MGQGSPRQQMPVGGDATDHIRQQNSKGSSNGSLGNQKGARALEDHAGEADGGASSYGVGGSTVHPIQEVVRVKDSLVQERRTMTSRKWKGGVDARIWGFFTAVLDYLQSGIATVTHS